MKDLDFARRAFVSDVVRWSRSGSDSLLARIVRSPWAGLPHDIGAAYARIGERSGQLFDALAAQRLRVSIDEREHVVLLTERLTKSRRAGDELDDERLAAYVETLFEHVRPPGDGAERAPAPNTGWNLGDARSAERPKGIRARQHHFSASALNAYAECERKWYYRYACSAVEDAGSSASFYGTAFHLALEDFHGEFDRPSPSLEAEMRERIVGYVNWAFERHRTDFDSPLEVELQKRRAQRTAQRYVDWLVSESAKRPFTVFGRESAANLDLDGYQFVGFIDRLDREDATGAVTVIDYKTGNIATSGAEYREKVRAYRDFQLPFYYWAQTAQGERVTRLALIPLKDALLDVAPVTLEVVAAELPGRRPSPNVISVAELERARARMIEICADLTGGGKTNFRVTTDSDACTYCAYGDACRARPQGDRLRFAR